jgi:hypothetical protein
MHESSFSHTPEASNQKRSTLRVHDPVGKKFRVDATANHPTVHRNSRDGCVKIAELFL